MDFSKRIQVQWTELWLTLTQRKLHEMFRTVRHPPQKSKESSKTCPGRKLACSHSYALDTFCSTRIASAREPPHPLTAPTAMSQKRWAHFLLVCERYSDERQALRRRTESGQSPTQTPSINHISAYLATLAYVQRTKRFPDVSNNKGSPPL